MKIIIGVVLWCWVWQAEAQPLQFAKSYEKAFAGAKQSGKYVLVYAYSPCSLCDEMNEKVLGIPEIADFLNGHFILVDMDLDEKEGVAFREKYGVKLCPTFFLFDAAGNLLHKIAGSCSAEEFPGKLNRAIDPQTNYASVKKRYDTGERSVDLLPKYMFAMDDAGEILTLSGTVGEFFKHFSLEDRVTPTAWTMFDFCIHDYRDTVFQDFLKNKDFYVAHVGKEKVEGKIRQVVFPAFLQELQTAQGNDFPARLQTLIVQSGDPEKKILKRLWELHKQKDYAGVMKVYEEEIFALDDPIYRSKYSDFLEPLLKGAGKEIHERSTAYILKCIADVRAIRSQLKKKP